MLIDTSHEKQLHNVIVENLSNLLIILLNRQVDMMMQRDNDWRISMISLFVYIKYI